MFNLLPSLKQLTVLTIVKVVTSGLLMKGRTMEAVLSNVKSPNLEWQT